MTPMPYKRLGTAVGIAVLLAACNTSDLLKVQAPNSVPSGIYSNPEYETLMVNSVIGDFECAFGSFVVADGISTDELHDASLNNGNSNLDRRDNGFTSGFYGVNACTTQTGIYTPLSTARGEADAAIKSLSGWTAAQVPNLVSLQAQANLYAGFSYATLGMAMCQAAFDLGPLSGPRGAGGRSNLLGSTELSGRLQRPRPSDDLPGCAGQSAFHTRGSRRPAPQPRRSR